MLGPVRRSKVDWEGVCLLVTGAIGAVIVAWTVVAWVHWGWDLVALQNYVPDPWGLFEEDSPIVGWLLGL